jgi:hypothetical protein
MEPMSNCQQWKLRTTKLALGVPENRQLHRIHQTGSLVI